MATLVAELQEVIRANTPDGTGVRDYIHVVDLARGHVKALKKIEDKSGLNIYNLGTRRIPEKEASNIFPEYVR